MKSLLIPQIFFIFVAFPTHSGNAASNDRYTGHPHLYTKSVYVEKDSQGGIVMELRCYDFELYVLRPVRHTGWLNLRLETQAQIPAAAKKLSPHFPLFEPQREAEPLKWKKFTLNQAGVGFDGIRMFATTESEPINCHLAVAVTPAP